jgi:hypothetical protein
MQKQIALLSNFALMAALSTSFAAVAEPSLDVQVASQLYTTDVPADRACEAAKLKIWRDAVERDCGSLFLDGRLRLKSETQDQLTIAQLQLQNGRVTEWAELSRDTTSTKTDSGDIGRCRVSGRLKTVCEPRETKAIAPLAVQLESATVRDGEALSIQIAASPEPYYLYAFSILPREPHKRQIAPLIPNALWPDEAIAANQLISLGTRHQIIARLPQDATHADEAILFVKTTSKSPAPISQMSLDQLNRWITQIPWHSRQEVLISYQIGEGPK